jgi:phosphohistidine phosphatase SixA
VIELYLIRHGVAEERGEEWPDDTKRPLSQEGIAKLR